MFFPTDVRAALKAYELHQLLPERYPEFYRVFMTLGQATRQALDFTDVQDRTGTSATTAARILYQMEEHGLVAVSMSPRDRRRKRAEMTQKGKRVLGELMRQFAELKEQQRKQYGDQETQVGGLAD